MSIQAFQVDGMTCDHCVMAVTQELTALVGDDAGIDVVLGSPSTVTITGGGVLGERQIAAALDEAGGYTLHTGSAS